jgi:membrane protein
MKIKLKDFFTLIKNSFKKWNERDPFRESAIIAYYAIFSLPGLMVVVISLAGYFFGQEAVSNQMHSQITSAIGEDAADQIQEMMAKAREKEDSIWATIIGTVTMLIGATGVFVQLQKSLNIIWEVKADESKSGIMVFLKSRFFSFGLIISIAFLLLISLVVSSMLAAAGEWVKAHWPDFVMFLFQAINFIVSLAVITLLFALMFKILPDAKIRWRFVWIGALLTALLFEIGKFGLSLYFGKAEPGSGYGAAGSIVLILLWVSYSSMIVFFGAEFTRAVADRFHGKVQPTEVAVKDPGRQI